MDRHCYASFLVAVVVTCQSQGNHAPKCTLRYRLFYLKWDLEATSTSFIQSMITALQQLAVR